MAEPGRSHPRALLTQPCDSSNRNPAAGLKDPPGFPTAPLHTPAVPGGQDTTAEGPICCRSTPSESKSGVCHGMHAARNSTSRWEAIPFGPINHSRKPHATPMARHRSAHPAPGQPRQSHILGFRSPTLPTASRATIRTPTFLLQPRTPAHCRSSPGRLMPHGRLMPPQEGDAGVGFTEKVG